MFELPECIVFSGQINTSMSGKTIRKGQLGNSPHKFVWYNRTHEEFEELTQGKTFGKAYSKGRWIFIPVLPGYVLVLGECGGKILYHQPGASLPKKYHLYITFDDDSFFTVTTQMWGAIELFDEGDELERDYVKDMKPTPIEPSFTYDYFSSLVDELIEGKKRSVKSLLTQDQIIPGLGNSIAQDIQFQSRLHPKYPIAELTTKERKTLYEAITGTVQQIIDAGGRYDEFDLYNNPGGYVRLMDKNTAGKPCPECGTTIEKIQYLGGACYFCPSCQAI
jgi:formamidopyrimidine-DNA glycosylase